MIKIELYGSRQHCSDYGRMCEYLSCEASATTTTEAAQWVQCRRCGAVVRWLTEAT